MADTNVLRATGVAKTYSEGNLRTEVLRDVNFMLERGQTLAIVGASGSGKSTLLHIVGGLDTASDGDIEVEGRALSKLSDRERGEMRNRSLGFVYQFHHLLPEFTAIENVQIPMLESERPRSERVQRAEELLKKVGLGHRLHRWEDCKAGRRQNSSTQHQALHTQQGGLSPNIIRRKMQNC